MKGEEDGEGENGADEWRKGDEKGERGERVKWKWFGEGRVSKLMGFGRSSEKDQKKRRRAQR